MPIVTVKQILECLELQPAPSGFTGQNLPIEYHRVFGGQVLAQAVVAAASTVEDKVPKSVSATFCREGRPEEPITYDVQATHDGRGFATRSVTARQSDRVIALLTVCLSRPDPEPSLDYQTRTAPPGPPDPGETDLVMVPFESRLANGVNLGSAAPEPPELVIWMRGCDLPGDEVTQRAVLAYVTIPTVIGTALRVLDGISVNDAYATTQTSITTHGLWFHRPVDLDGWFVLDQTAPVAAGGQAYGLGDVFDRSGSHIASYAQDSMIRRA